MSFTLRAHPSFAGARGPVVLAVLDGVGIGSGDESDAVTLAATPTLDAVRAPGAYCQLAAHGTAVGLPGDGDMGNSEVGHNALGCGRVYEQGALLVGRAIEIGTMFDGEVWKETVGRCINAGSTLHFIGLLSDGNVHSHIDHLCEMVRRAAADGVGTLRVHVLTDGRDVPPRSALRYVDTLEAVLGELSAAGMDARIGSGGGRMLITMDRYEADWSMVERGWRTHVHGDGRRFSGAREAIETLRSENPDTDDQYLPPFVIADGGEPVGLIRDGDAVICFNFRGDRAIELSLAFDDAGFEAFDRGRVPDVLYAGMMEYDGDTRVPRRFLVEPPAIERTMGEFLVHNGVHQLAISETQKYGHVTYFWNGNRSGKFDDSSETYLEVSSDRVPFDQRPWMKAAEITDRLIAELRSGVHQFVRVNYANGDMVGHTGDLVATVIAVEIIDLQLARLRKVVDELDGILVITADHGNADEMYQHTAGQVVRQSASGSPMVKTSHTLNPVPFIVHDINRSDLYRVDAAPGGGIASVTASCLELLGFVPPADLAPSRLRFK